MDRETRRKRWQLGVTIAVVAMVGALCTAVAIATTVPHRSHHVSFGTVETSHTTTTIPTSTTTTTTVGAATAAARSDTRHGRVRVATPSPATPGVVCEENPPPDAPGASGMTGTITFDRSHVQAGDTVGATMTVTNPTDHWMVEELVGMEGDMGVSVDGRVLWNGLGAQETLTTQLPFPIIPEYGWCTDGFFVLRPHQEVQVSGTVTLDADLEPGAHHLQLTIFSHAIDVVATAEPGGNITIDPPQPPTTTTIDEPAPTTTTPTTQLSAV